MKKELLPTKAADQVQLCSPLWEDNCILNKRLTVNQLCKNYSEKVSNAQKVYLEHLTDAEEYLCKNLQMAIKMDERFGTEEPKGPDGSDDITESSEGNIYSTMPFLDMSDKDSEIKTSSFETPEAA